MIDIYNKDVFETMEFIPEYLIALFKLLTNLELIPILI
jgi:hypothetical protein